MKIAFISFYSGQVNRGVETYAHELANRLEGLGNEVTVYQGGKKKTDAIYKVKTIARPINWSEKSGDNTFLRKLFLDYRSLQIALFSVEVVSDMIRQDYDIVVPLNGGWQALFIKLVTLLKGIKMVVSGQSGPGRDDKFNLFMFPSAFIGFTDFQCKWAKGVNGYVRIEKIPNGVDTTKFNKNGSKIKTKLKHPIVLISAALVPIKRIDLTIQAVAKLENVSLLIAGDGELKTELEKLGNQLLPGRFEIRKFSYDQMPKVYRQADVFAFSTQSWESFGIVILEALATNVPVVVSDDPIRKEIIGNAGYTVNVSDIGKYSEALNKSIIKKWNNIPVDRATRYSWDIIADKYNKLFQSLTNEN